MCVLVVVVVIVVVVIETHHTQYAPHTTHTSHTTHTHHTHHTHHTLGYSVGTLLTCCDMSINCEDVVSSPTPTITSRSPRRLFEGEGVSGYTFDMFVPRQETAKHAKG